MNMERGEIPSGFEEKAAGNTEPEPMQEKATDMEAATFLIGHIDNPCEVEVSPGQVENIRDFYLREAKRILPTFSDSYARELLELKIQEYEKE